jgi:hypothetical protein
MSNPVTIVTAFFDINRAEKGDGRTIDEYKQWIKHTLMLNCNLFIITEEKFKDFFIENRNNSYNTHIILMKLEDLHYYRYYDNIKTIIESDQYKQKIAYPNRVECVLPEYNIIQYSKFHFLKIASTINPFNSDYFFWLDAGASRFFSGMDISMPFPSQNGIDIVNSIAKSKESPSKFIAQCRPDLETYKFDERFIWTADNLIYGGMFGGDKYAIDFMFTQLENVFVNIMLRNGNVNNEQLALAIIVKQYPDAFTICKTRMNEPILLLKILSS